MKLHVLLLGLLVLYMLASCAPTTEPPVETPVGALEYRLTTAGDVLLKSNVGEMASGAFDLFGAGLEVESPYCLDACRPNEVGFIEFELPEQLPLVTRLEVNVLAGVPRIGQATVTPQGSTQALVAAFRPCWPTPQGERCVDADYAAPRAR